LQTLHQFEISIRWEGSIDLNVKVLPIHLPLSNRASTVFLIHLKPDNIET